jgi:hypothetical protein
MKSTTSNVLASVLLAFLLATQYSNFGMVRAAMQPCGDGLACQEGFQCCVPGPNGCCNAINAPGPACTACIPPGAGRRLRWVRDECPAI